MTKLAFVCCLALFSISTLAQESAPTTSPARGTDTAPSSQPAPEPRIKGSVVDSLGFRSIGPALMSGRISDLAVHPLNKNLWYVAVASGGLWKTENAGTTFSPIFDSYGSFSIGCVTLDPSNPDTVWVGTGENNSQRSVAYGDGVYRSRDGGKTFENVGLKESEHVGMIRVHPHNSQIVFVASQGPLWRNGGDRGLYKTMDGGATWTRILEISDKTGISEIHLDPLNPDIMYAVAYQRRRHVWTLLNGGPESTVMKSMDGGASWRKIEAGLPGGDKGRIGLALAPSQPRTLYAIVEATRGNSGFYRSDNGGETWEKRSSYVSSSPQYYQEIVVDPHEPDFIYSLDTYLVISEDGGKTTRRAGEAHKHVDNHALWIDPDDTRHLVVGCDGGLYESFDRGATFKYAANLPITQFYRVAVDRSKPFYYVYGGTQDNNTQGGPSRTTNRSGIRNSDWFITVGGDGFWAAIDPLDPNIVYSEWQHGGLIRFDRRTGEDVDIRPLEEPGEEPLKWNWDSPLVLSPHQHTRLYFAAQRIYRTDDRGHSWRPVSPDLTRRIDRNKLPVMDRVWSIDAVAKNASTSFFGSIVSLTESHLVEGLLWAGTDDGCVQVTEDGGLNWRGISTFPDVPDMTYVADIAASRHDRQTAYVAFDNHKMGDFKPYLLKTTDLGKTWTSVSGDLPGRGEIHTFVEDPVNPRLLFVGTEFGVFATLDGGTRWFALRRGIPVIAVRDLVIQEDKNDLVAATFGRGFYILDDISVLRELSEEQLAKDAIIFPIPTALWYVEDSPLGGSGKAWQGDDFYFAPNPPFGAQITYHLRDGFKSLKDRRKNRERELEQRNEPVPYPTWDDLRAESNEVPDSVELQIRDSAGVLVRRLPVSNNAGIYRIYWDLRVASPTVSGGAGPLVAPGQFSAQLVRRRDGTDELLTGSTRFSVQPLRPDVVATETRPEVLLFQQKMGRLKRALDGTVNMLREAQTRLESLRRGFESSPLASVSLVNRTRDLEQKVATELEGILGDTIKPAYNEPSPLSLTDRLNTAVNGTSSITGQPTDTHRRQYELVATEFALILPRVTRLIEVDFASLEQDAESMKIPWTSGRMPRWTKE